MEQFLPFERPIEHAENALRRLAWRIRQGTDSAQAAYGQQFTRLDEARRVVFNRLDAWERVQLARHPRRPHGLQAANVLFGELEAIRGDRGYADDPAVVTGIGRWRERPVAVVACERGSGKRDGRRRNFGMPGPHGFRKAARLLTFAERRRLPVVSLVDTPGAYPGVESERYCIAEAISRLLWTQASVKTPTLGVVLGEGGSGGALAFAMGDRMVMMQYAYFSVISPEACASILWRDGAKTALAADKLKLLPENLLAFGIVDAIVPEPPGGAHRQPTEALCELRATVDRYLAELIDVPTATLLAERRRRYRAFGAFREAEAA